MAPKKKSKTAASSSQAPPLTWTRRDSLSAFPPREQPRLYHSKLKELRNEVDRFLLERPVDTEEFEDYGLVDAFTRLGWYQALYPNGVPQSFIYPDVILDWMATLRRDDGDQPPRTTTLTGLVGHDEVVLSYDSVRAALNIDTRDDYEQLSDAVLRFKIQDDEAYNRMVSELFIVKGHPGLHKLESKTLKPFPRMLFRLLTFNVIPRAGDRIIVRKYDLRALYALVTGRNPVPLYHHIVTHIWEARENYEKTTVPYTRLINRILDMSGMVTPEARSIHVPTHIFNQEWLENDKFTFTEDDAYWILIDNHEKDGESPFRQKRFPKPGVAPAPEPQPQEAPDQYFEYLNQPHNPPIPEGYPNWEPFQQQMFDYTQQSFGYLNTAVRGIGLSQREMFREQQTMKARQNEMAATQARQEEKINALMYYQQRYQHHHYDYTEAAAQHHGHPYHMHQPSYHYSQHMDAGASSSSQQPYEPDFLGVDSITRSFYETFFFPSGPVEPSNPSNEPRDD